ncbi:MAG TPA: hypothetical protein VMW65_14585 [Chloroflexota bacterium]|nr:hypothetical protein [Chloroflexota bacterium]
MDRRAAAVARRLMADDMFCGWGIRTLSSQNGACNPVAYQRGSIPEWLAQITLRRLPFADGTLDLRFTRDGSGSHCDVLSCSGAIEVEAD